MSRHYCTLFDINYLPRALVLHDSLLKHGGDFVLHAYCMDARSEELLRVLELPNVVPIALDELERNDPGLLAVKGERSTLEYFWTATPAICLDALARNPALEEITYLDADVVFFENPAPLFEEMGANSVMIVPHRYAERWRAWEEKSGVYCVEWLTFKADERAFAALRWWRERCLEWCFDRVEDGKMGDQKYLDDWPERFDGVHVLAHIGGGVAPWNVENYELRKSGADHFVDGVPLIFFHYHNLRLYSGPLALTRIPVWKEPFEVTAGTRPMIWKHDHPIRPEDRKLLWDPYIVRLSEAIDRVRAVAPGFSVGSTRLERVLYETVVRRVRSAARRAAVQARLLLVDPGSRD